MLDQAGEGAGVRAGDRACEAGVGEEEEGGGGDGEETGQGSQEEGNRSR